MQNPTAAAHAAANQVEGYQHGSLNLALEAEREASPAQQRDETNGSAATAGTHLDNTSNTAAQVSCSMLLGLKEAAGQYQLWPGQVIVIMLCMSARLLCCILKENRPPDDFPSQKSALELHQQKILRVNEAAWLIRDQSDRVPDRIGSGYKVVRHSHLNPEVGFVLKTSFRFH